MSEEFWWARDLSDEETRRPRLSVIVPVYNEQFLVGASLTRLLEVEMPSVRELEVIVVDDASTDGSVAIIESVIESFPGRIQLLRQEKNGGKGSAVRRGIAMATGDLIVIHDADLEYDPADLETLVQPFVMDGADVVYGSRFAASARRRVVYFKHSLGNQLITFLSNLVTDLNLSDVETCYKMFRAPLVQSLPIRSNDFRLEIELTAKVAKRNCVVYEVPISYRGRSYAEGKKIGWRDGVLALLAITKYWILDDLYKEDAWGGEILHSLERARRFNGWMADAIRPHLGDKVLEIGAGIGNITTQLIPRHRYIASDINPNYLHYLRNLSTGKPYLEIAKVDLEDASCFEPIAGKVDTVVCLNVLEHVGDPVVSLRNLFEVLEPGGRLILYVPRGPGLYSPIDEALGHRCRYTRKMLREELESAGFELEEMRDFNRASVLGWWWNGRVLKRKTFSRVQLKIFNALTPLIRRLDWLLPWKGLGLIAIGRKPAT